MKRPSAHLNTRTEEERSISNNNISHSNVFRLVFCLMVLPLLSLQGKKGRPGEDGRPGPKGQKVMPAHLTISCCFVL